MCFFVVACSSGKTDGTTTDPSNTETEKKPDIPIEPSDKPGENTVITAKAGRHLSVVYNPAYCSVTAEVKKGVGSKEEVTLKIKMFGDTEFDGWSKISALPNENATVYVTEGGKRTAKKLKDVAGGALLLSKETEYTITLSEELTVYANYGFSVTYDACGGTVKGGGSTYVQKYSAVMYKCPNTLPDKNYFVRDGYTLVEYNTKPDGSGTAVGLGSRVAMNGGTGITLYCIWESRTRQPILIFQPMKTGLP